MAVLAHVVRTDAALNSRGITTSHAITIAVTHMSAEISVMTIRVFLAPSHPYDTLLVDHKVLVAVVMKTFRMLALVLRPYFGGTGCVRCNLGTLSAAAATGSSVGLAPLVQSAQTVVFETASTSPVC
eukprot:4085083-Amphidinium_carterae.2